MTFEVQTLGEIVQQSTSPSGEVVLRRLAGSLAHHVNNALTGVIGYLELALRQASPKSRIHEHLKDSLACAFQAAEAVKRIVAFACREPGAETMAPLCLARLAEKIVREQQGKMPANIRLVVETEPVGPVLASVVLVRTTLEQLIQNAVEAQPTGGQVVVRVEAHHEHVCIRVKDRGPGLSAEAKQHLFEPFFSTKTSGHLGLGLALCQDMTQAQDGALTLESQPGQGTTAQLLFPQLAPLEPTRMVDAPAGTVNRTAPALRAKPDSEAQPLPAPPCATFHP